MCARLDPEQLWFRHQYCVPVWTLGTLIWLPALCTRLDTGFFGHIPFKVCMLFGTYILIMLFDQFYIDLIIAHRSCNNRGCCMMLLYMYAHRFSTSFGLLLTHQQLKLYSNKYIWKLDKQVLFNHPTVTSFMLTTATCKTNCRHQKSSARQSGWGQWRNTLWIARSWHVSFPIGWHRCWLTATASSSFEHIDRLNR